MVRFSTISLTLVTNTCYRDSDASAPAEFPPDQPEADLTADGEEYGAEELAEEEEEEAEGVEAAPADPDAMVDDEAVSTPITYFLSFHLTFVSPRHLKQQPPSRKPKAAKISKRRAAEVKKRSSRKRKKVRARVVLMMLWRWMLLRNPPMASSIMLMRLWLIN
jgi:hypothetical protein